MVICDVCDDSDITEYYERRLELSSTPLNMKKDTASKELYLVILHDMIEEHHSCLLQHST